MYQSLFLSGSLLGGAYSGAKPCAELPYSAVAQVASTARARGRRSLNQLRPGHALARSWSREHRPLLTSAPSFAAPADAGAVEICFGH